MEQLPATNIRKNSICVTFPAAAKSMERRRILKRTCAGTPESGHSAANGFSAARASPAPTSSSVTCVLTPARSVSPAQFATSVSCAPITFLNTPRRTNLNGPRGADRTPQRLMSLNWKTNTTISTLKMSRVMTSPALNGRCRITLKNSLLKKNKKQTLKKKETPFFVFVFDFPRSSLCYFLCVHTKFKCTAL